MGKNSEAKSMKSWQNVREMEANKHNIEGETMVTLACPPKASRFVPSGYQACSEPLQFSYPPLLSNRLASLTDPAAERQQIRREPGPQVRMLNTQRCADRNKRIYREKK
jgi:hypothetical protein